MTAKVYELLAECVRGKDKDDFVLTRKGNKRVKDFRVTWQNMCVAAGPDLGRWLCRPCQRKGVKRNSPPDGETCAHCGRKATVDTRVFEGKIPHDMRRSAAKAARRAGIPESVVMAMGGWKTASVFRRYAIVSSADQRAAAEMLEQSRATQAGSVAPLLTSFGSGEAATTKGTKPN
ncbi:MAG TPA: hypothetical protein VI488_13880 [Candidatus Angelobacter sp.]